jgi:hypothetical protein
VHFAALNERAEIPDEDRTGDMTLAARGLIGFPVPDAELITPA